MVDEFKYRKKVLDSMGIEMAIVINPTKYSIYPEYLPKFLVNNYAITGTKKLLNAIQTKTDINIIYTKYIFLLTITLFYLRLSLNLIFIKN